MPKLTAFNLITLDGYFSGEYGDISWHGKFTNDPEWSEFSQQNARGGGMLLFGRVTYELMASFWPTPMASEFDAVTAERMNNLPKIVFSRTLEKASWNNSRVVTSDPTSEVRELKSGSGKDMAILGSGSIIRQLAPEGLIDEYQFVVVPVVLGKGRTIFEGIRTKLSLRLTKSRTFKNGNVLLVYEPVG